MRIAGRLEAGGAMLPLLAALGISPAVAQDGTKLQAEADVVYVDEAGVGSSNAVSIAFTATGAVTVDSVSIENTKGNAFKSDGPPTLDVSGGSGTLELLYEPTERGQQSARVTIASNADCTLPQVLEVRSSAYVPCIVASPLIMDWGEVPVGDADLILLSLKSCDGRNHTVNSALTDNSRFAFGAPTPFDITPTGVNVTVQYTPIDDTPQGGTLTIGDWGTTIQLIANDCYAGNPDNYDSDGDGISDCGIPSGGQWTDDDGDGWSEVEGDCDDLQAAINPDAVEVDGGVDDNCNGLRDEHKDADGDNVQIPEDCDDTDAWVSIGEFEVFDGRDNDCDGQVDDGVSPQTCSDGTDTGAGTGSGGCGCTTPGPTPVGVGSIVLLVLVGFRRTSETR